MKDLMYEVIPGFLRKNCIFHAVWDIDCMENKDEVKQIYDWVKSSIPGEQAGLIESESVRMQDVRVPGWRVKGKGVKVV